MGWLAINIAHAATAASLNTLAQSRDWKTKFCARSAIHYLDEADRSEDGWIYRARARRYVVGLAAALRAP